MKCVILCFTTPKGGCSVVELIQTEALEKSSVSHSTCQLSMMPYRKITQIMPFKGHAGAIEAALGMKLPEPNRCSKNRDLSVQWFGRETYLVLDGDVPSGLSPHAALSDQSDGWVEMMLEGATAEDILSRLVPVDLRAAHFPQGNTVRSLIQHMNGAVTRTGSDAFVLMVMRSMAQTLWHDVETAMQSVARR